MTTRNMGAKHVLVAMVGVVKDLTTYLEAIQSAKVEKWRDAMHSEIDSLKANGKWKLIIRRPGQNLLHSEYFSRPRST